MSRIEVNQIGATSPDIAVNFTGNVAPTFNGVPLGTGGGGGGGGGGGPASGWVDPRVIRTTPPAATGLSATGAFRNVILSWSLENYINHGYVRIYRNTVDNQGTATLIGTSTTNFYNDSAVTVGNSYYYWVRAVNIEEVVGPFNASAGTLGSLLRIGNTDLGSLVVEAANLANGSVTAAKLAANSISLTQFAAGIEPISVVSSLPAVSGYTGPRIVLLTTDNKIYRYTGTAWVTGVAAPDLTGTITNTQIAGLDASKLTGTLNSALIAAGTIDATKFATSIEPVTNVTSIPSVKSTNLIFHTGEGRLYRWNGTSYVASIAASDVGNGLTSDQIASLDAAKLIGTINVARIAAGALDATKFANNIEPIGIVSSIPTVKSTNTIFNTADGKLYRWNGTAYVSTIAAADISGTIAPDRIADGSLGATKFASSIEPYTLVDSIPGTKLTNVIFNTTDGKLYRWNGSGYVSSIPGSDVVGPVSTTGIADGSITATMFASSIQPIGVVATIPTTKTTDMVFVIADKKLYRWNGTAYVRAIDAADITIGQITSTQIADGSITTPKLVANSINANVLAAGTITSNLITANTLNGDRILANSLDAGKIVAGSITASQIAAEGITGDRIAANTITADKLTTNSVTSDKIAANSITSDKIAANSIDAGKIVAGSITATELAAAGITGDRIAANTITADKISTNSITSTQIAAGSITGDRLAANTITAGQIAAGAIGAEQIAAGAITAGKLLVTGQGTALNDDPATMDLTAWGSLDGAFPQRVTITDGVYGTSAFKFTNMGAIKSRAIPIVAGKTYKVTSYIKRVSGSGTCYLRLQLFTSSDVFISEAIASILPNVTGNLESFTPTNTFTAYSGKVTAPANAVKGYVTVYANYNTTGETIVQGLRLEEYIGADLIVDGTITSNLLAANGINGDRILANSLAADKIIAGSITTDRFGANSIGGTILQDGTVNANKLVANSITAGQIAAGAISAQQIAAGAITATKLVLVNRDSVFPDPTWEDRQFWTAGVSVTNKITKEYEPSWPIPNGLKFTGSTGNFDFNTSYFPIEIGASYRCKVYIYMTSDFAGHMDITQEYPGIQYFQLGIPRGGTNPVTGLPTIDTGLPKNTFLQYVTTYNNPNYIVNASNPNNRTRFRFAGNVTSGSFYFWMEIVRAGTSDLIVDGSIITQKMMANSINGDRIATNTLDADRIVSNSITAGKIAAGAIGVEQIAAGAIRAQHILVMPKSLYTDPDFEQGSLYSGFVQRLPKDQAANGNAPVQTIAQFNLIDNLRHGSYPTAMIPVVPGEQYRVSLWTWNGSGGGNNGIVGAAYYTANNSYQYFALTTTTALNSWVRLSEIYTVPAGVSRIDFGPRTDATGTANRWFGDLTVEKLNDASLIVDGAITATKLAANSIAVGTAAIQNGAIANAMIADLAVDSAKIADLAVTNAKIGNLEITDAKIANGTISYAKIGSVDADTITVGTLQSARIAANSITADKLSINQLSSVSSELGTVTVGASGYMRSGQSDYNTGVGWWLGTQSGVPKFSIGNPNGAYLRWTGSGLEIKGASLVSPILPSFSATTTGPTNVFVDDGNVYYGRVQVNVTGGEAPYSYLWSLVYYFSNGIGTYTAYIGGSQTSAFIDLLGYGINAGVTMFAACTITDSTGRNVVVEHQLNAVHGNNPLP